MKYHREIIDKESKGVIVGRRETTVQIQAESNSPGLRYNRPRFVFMGAKL